MCSFVQAVGTMVALVEQDAPEVNKIGSIHMLTDVPRNRKCVVMSVGSRVKFAAPGDTVLTVAVNLFDNSIKLSDGTEVWLVHESNLLGKYCEKQFVLFDDTFTFTFDDEVTDNGRFVDENLLGSTVLAGIQRDRDDRSAKSGRIVTVTGIGPSVKHLRVGMKVVLPALRWSSRNEYDEVVNWLSRETEFAAHVIDGLLIPANDFVLYDTTTKYEDDKDSLIYIPTGYVQEDMIEVIPSGKIIGQPIHLDQHVGLPNNHIHEVIVFNGTVYGMIKSKEVPAVFTKE